MAEASANMNLMIKAARAAGRSLMKDFLEVENLQVSRKGASDFVSKADTRAEEKIREILMETRPNYGWIGEESEPVEGKDPTRYWIVDPLDGTTNYLHGLPHWAISIALAFRGEIVAGVILDPVKNELFTAEKGSGAWLNEGRIRVSERVDFSEMIFATGIPFQGRGDLKKSVNQVLSLSAQCAGIRRFGAAALDLAYVAAGRYDGFFEENDLKPWDIAAGELIAREAGAFIRNFKDDSATAYNTGTVIAAPSQVIDKLSDIVK